MSHKNKIESDKTLAKNIKTGQLIRTVPETAKVLSIKPLASIMPTASKDLFQIEAEFYSGPWKSHKATFVIKGDDTLDVLRDPPKTIWEVLRITGIVALCLAVGGLSTALFYEPIVQSNIF